MRRSTHYLKNKFRPYSIFEDKYSFIKSNYAKAWPVN